MSVEIIHCDARCTPLRDRSVHAIITSPPYYGLRRYLDPNDPLAEAEIGSERTPQEYVANILECSWEWKRVLRDDGVLWLNIGDSYANDGKWGGATGGKHARWLHGGETRVGREKRRTALRPKSLCMIPEECARALRRDGWILRASVPWYKGNAMPSSVRDRPGTAHEMLYLFTKEPAYFWDHVAVLMPFADERQGRDGSALIRERNRGGRQDGFTKPNGIDPSANGGRFLRTSDLFRAGLDAYIKHLQAVRDNGGLLLDPDGDPLAFLVNTQRSDLKHYAMWPQKLVEPLIKASTSERGCCPTCGAPWRRLVESVRLLDGEPADLPPARNTSKAAPTSGSGIGHARIATKRETKGWAATCSCNAGEPIPCTVYDPFGGAGTTAKVAQDLGRHAVITELNRAYLPIAQERTGGTVRQDHAE